MRSFKLWFLPAVVILSVLAPGSVNAGLNSGAQAFLSWDPDSVVSDLSNPPNAVRRLYVRLEGLNSIRAAEVLVLWAPTGLESGAYQLLNSDAPTSSDCTWLLRGLVITLREETDSTLRISSTGDLNSACTSGNVFYLDFPKFPPGQTPAGMFSLGFARVLDSNGDEDDIALGPPATMKGGTVEPAPVLLSHFPSTGWVDRTVGYHLGGYNFLGSLSVTFERSGSTSLLGSVDLLSDKQAYVTFSFVAADSGLWDIVLTNPGGRSTGKLKAIRIYEELQTEGALGGGSPAAGLTVQFESDVLPLIGPSRIALSALTGGDTRILSKLSSLGVSTIQCLWPKLTPQPTIAIQPDGSREALVDFGNYYSLTFETAELATNAKHLLRDDPAVRSISQWREKAGSALQVAPFCPPATIPDCNIFGGDDASFFEQWYLLHDDEFHGGIRNEDIRSPCAWTIPAARGNSAVIIGIVDSGIDASHPDLAHTAPWGNKILPGINFSSTGLPFDITDLTGHGTSVAGLAAAITNDGVSTSDPDQGMAGVAGGLVTVSQPDSVGVRILPVKVLDGFAFNNPDIVSQGINFAAQEGAKVINLSIGILRGADPATIPPSLRDALFNAMKLGATCVAGMGNDDTSDPFYPAKFAKWGLCIAVGATELCGLPMELSGETLPFGKGTTKGTHVDVVAPGFKIFTTTPLDAPSNNLSLPTRYTERFFGTSWSTALVSGVAASLLSVRPTLRDNDIKTILRHTAVDIHGLLDVLDPDEAALNATMIGRGRVEHNAAAKLVNPANGTLHLVTDLSNPTLTSQGTVTLDIRASGLGLGIDGVHVGAEKFEARFDVTFPFAFFNTPLVWARVVGTTGWSPDNPHLFNYGWGEVIEGTETTTSVSFRTFLYQLSDDTWVPVSPAQLRLKYAALGIPSGTTAVGDKFGKRGLQVELVGNPSQLRVGMHFRIGAVPGKELRLEVFNVRGRRVVTKSEKVPDTGILDLKWDASTSSGQKVAAGVYFYQIEQDGRTENGKFVLLR